MKLSLGTSPFWGYELTWAGATKQRLQSSSEETDPCQGCSLLASPAQGPPAQAWWQPWAYTASECLGKGA